MPELLGRVQLIHGKERKDEVGKEQSAKTGFAKTHADMTRSAFTFDRRVILRSYTPTL